MGEAGGLQINRRDLVKAGMFAGAAAALPLRRMASAELVYPNRMAESKLPLPFSRGFRRPSVLSPVSSDGICDKYAIRLEAFQTEIIPGYQTLLFGYNGEVPGPTIRVPKGRETKIRFTNNLPARHPYLNYVPTSSTHLHGSPSLPQYDGYASDTTNPGYTKDYFYPNGETGRTLWYHDHGHHHTAENVYMGLAGQYHLIDPIDEALPLPKGDYDVPLVLTDAMFQANGNLLYGYSDDSGHWGDVNLVNGVAWPVMKVARRKYRFRILNGSMARSYNIEMDTGDNFSVVGTDAGLMPAPQRVRRLKIGNGERYEVVVDFARFAPGTKIVLRNSSPKNNVNFSNTSKVMMFEVTADAFDPSNNAVPSVLRPDNPAMTTSVADSVATRVLKLYRTGGQWTINGHTWDYVAKSGHNFVEWTPREHDTEIWEVWNDSGGWFHPVHIHLVDFKILSRNGNAPYAYERGPKDTVYVGENERVRLLMRFEGCGKYMIHCHNLRHEDHDMMTQYEVVSDHPMDSPLAAPALPTSAAGPL